jgi:asparagine synthase (glutamine-hydrolysing)
MSMAHSLEVRVPFLDQALVELVARLPAEYKSSRRGEKPLLVAAVRDLLPEIVVRRRKAGFVLPFDEWLRGPMRSHVGDVLGDDSVGGQMAGVISGVAACELWAGFLRGETSWSRPWAVYVAKMWGERNL